MAKTVWVIEDGSYSDYRVVGVYSSKENCERILSLINRDRKGELAEMAEWPLDPCIDSLNSGLDQWRVTMLKDGSVEEVEHYGGAYDLSAEICVTHRSQWRFLDYPKPDCIQPIVWAENAQHAVKIVNEHRIRMIATGEWK
jgi:hypothetical protein